MEKQETTHETLCWGCEKAQKRCSWSRKFEPVKGWEAKPTTVYIREETLPSGEVKRYYQDSFDVYKCPEFEPLKGMKKDPTIDDVAWLKTFKESKREETEAQKQRREWQELIRKMIFEENKSVAVVAKELGYSKRYLYRVKKGMEKENAGK